VAASDSGFLFTSGLGEVWRDGRRLTTGPAAWDNHLTAL